MPKNQPTDEPRPADTTTTTPQPQPTTDSTTAQVEQQIVEVVEHEETSRQD